MSIRKELRAHSQKQIWIGSVITFMCALVFVIILLTEAPAHAMHLGGLAVMLGFGLGLIGKGRSGYRLTKSGTQRDMQQHLKSSYQEMAQNSKTAKNVTYLLLLTIGGFVALLTVLYFLVS